jgi:anti-sigma factor (TIGR02949 family)
MNCTEASRLLGAYLDRELDAQATLALEAHANGCARCRGELGRLTALRAAVTRACPPAAAPASLRSAVRSAAHATPVQPARWQWLLAAPGVAALLLGLWIVVAQPWTPAAPDGMRVVYHVASAENFGAILRTLKNHLDASPGVRVVVVAHNNGIEFLLEGARDEAGRPLQPVLQEFRDRGVDFRVCTNTLTRRNIDARAVVPQAVLVPSGIAEINRLQGREGYTYLRL